MGIELEEDLQANMLEEIAELPQQKEYELPDMIEVQEFDRIYVTYDYSAFKMIRTNRNLNPKNRAKILKSCKKQQLVRPINVSLHEGNLYIVDGQHRFSVWKELNQPVYFIITSDFADSEFEMKEMNLSGVVWNKATFLESYIKAGKEPYLVFKSLLERTGFSIDLLLSVFNHFQVTDMEQINEAFREGNLSLNAIDDIEQFIFFYNNFITYKSHKKSNFIKALLRVYSQDGVDRDYLIKQYHRHQHNLKSIRVGSIRKYIGTIMNDVYSVQTPEVKALYFNVEKGRFHK